MNDTEAPSECILIVLDGYQRPLAELSRTHPCVRTNSPPCRVRLSRCVRRSGTHVGHGMHGCGNSRVAYRGRVGRLATLRFSTLGRCQAARDELACIHEGWARGTG